MSAAGVPLPVGAHWPDEGIGWEPDEPQPSRTIYGVPRSVTGHDVLVQTCALQFADGSFDAQGGAHATVEICRADGLSSTQARELAATLIDAADELDGWAHR